MFKRTQPEPQVEWVTGTLGVAETWPIIPARKLIPDWFKASESKIHAATAHGHGFENPPAPSQPPGPPRLRDYAPTIRQCPGVVDVMMAGYVLRAWTDIEIITPEPPGGMGTDRHMAVSAMGPELPQMGAFGPYLNQKLPLWPGEYDFALKIDTPWCAKLPPGWSLLYLPIPYAEKQPFRVLHGITDNDAFHVVNVLAMWDHVGSYIIEAGTPLAWLLPIHRDGYRMNTKVHYDPDRYSMLRSVGKGGVGIMGGRLIHGSYVKDRIRRRRLADEKD